MNERRLSILKSVNIPDYIHMNIVIILLEFEYSLLVRKSIKMKWIGCIETFDLVFIIYEILKEVHFPSTQK